MTSNGKSVCKQDTKERLMKIQSMVGWLAQHVGLLDTHFSPEADVPVPTDKMSFFEFQFGHIVRGQA